MKIMMINNNHHPKQLRRGAKTTTTKKPIPPKRRKIENYVVSRDVPIKHVRIMFVLNMVQRKVQGNYAVTKGKGRKNVPIKLGKGGYV